MELGHELEMRYKKILLFKVYYQMTCLTTCIKSKGNLYY